MLKAIAVDDEPPALEIIESYCKRSENVELLKAFTGTAKALEYLENFPVDLIFLDINMPTMSGLEFYKRIGHSAMVIFTTSYSEYAVESYNLNAIDYLLKPYTFSRWQKAVEKAIKVDQFERQSGQEQQHLTLRVDYSLVRVALADILFIEGLDNYLKIHIHNQDPLVVRMTMKNIQDKLPEKDFVRVHRSYIVSMSKIEAVRNKVIRIGSEEIPLGSSYEKSFLSVFEGGDNVL